MYCAGHKPQLSRWIDADAPTVTEGGRTFKAVDKMPIVLGAVCNACGRSWDHHAPALDVVLLAHIQERSAEKNPLYLPLPWDFDPYGPPEPTDLDVVYLRKLIQPYLRGDLD